MAPPSQKKQQLPQAGKPPPATDTPTSASQDEHPNPNSDEPPDSVNINPNNNTNDDDDSETQSLLSSRPTNTTPLIPPPLPPHGHDDDDTPTTSLSTIQIINLNAFWFGYQLLWFLVFVVVVPAQVAEIAGPQGKGRALSAVSLCGGILNLGLAVLVGAFNDRSSGGKFGKRHPWIILGALGMCLTLFLMWPTTPLPLYILFFTLFTASTVLCSVPFNGLIADVTPAHQKARVSAIMGGMNLAGYLTGAVVGIVAAEVSYLVLYALMTVLMGTATYMTVCLGPREPAHHYIPQEELPPIDWKPFMVGLVKPLWTHRDFALVFASRFLFQLGIGTIQQFMQYFIQDCVPTTLPPTRAVSLALLPLLLTSPLTALLTTSLPLKKPTVYTSALLFTLTSLLLISTRSFPVALVASTVFGVGYGPFVSVEFAMLMDVLPGRGDVARDISLWHSALVLPQIVAVPLAGVVRDVGQRWGEKAGDNELTVGGGMGMGGGEGEERGCLGYQMIFAICIVYFAAGVVATRAIRGVR